MYILFWRGFVIFILFSPRSGLCTIREKAGTSNWVLVRLRSIRSLPRPPSIVSFLFPKMCDVTNVHTYVRKKNQTSKVSLCCKRTGSKNGPFLIILVTNLVVLGQYNRYCSRGTLEFVIAIRIPLIYFEWCDQQLN